MVQGDDEVRLGLELEKTQRNCWGYVVGPRVHVRDRLCFSSLIFFRGFVILGPHRVLVLIARTSSPGLGPACAKPVQFLHYSEHKPYTLNPQL